jgi:hypothetical protein
LLTLGDLLFSPFWGKVNATIGFTTNRRTSRIPSREYSSPNPGPSWFCLKIGYPGYPKDVMADGDFPPQNYTF